MHNVLQYKNLPSAKSTTSLFRLLFKSSGLCDVVADGDLLQGFIYTEQVFYQHRPTIKCRSEFCLNSHSIKSAATLIFHVLVFHFQTDVIKLMYSNNCGLLKNTGTKAEESRVTLLQRRDSVDFEYVDFMSL